MIVPVDILSKLKCSNCKDLLSCGPVLLKHDGSNICGRCTNPEEKAVPNMPYNELAEMCAFPCKYEAEGCYEKITFASMKKHEEDCDFRLYICPVMPTGSCDWVGTRNKIQEHTQEVHPEKILVHPCEMSHDIKTASLKTFLATVFNVMFLIQYKVCLGTYNIYHSVRKIGEISDNHVYKYELKIIGKKGALIRCGDVAPQDNLALQENISIAVQIKTMIEALGGFNECKFVITIYEYMKCYQCKEIKSSNETVICDKINEIFYCLPCSTNLISCTNSSKGCTWKGFSDFCFNHEKLLCSFTTWCNTCNFIIQESNMLDHMQRNYHTLFKIKHLHKKYWIANIDTKQDNIIISTGKSSFLLFYTKHDKLSYKFILYGSYNCANKVKYYLILRNSSKNYFSHYLMDLTYSIADGQFVGVLILNKNILDTFIIDKKFEVGVEIYSSE